MVLSKRYDPGEVEPRLQSLWESLGIYRFSRSAQEEVFSIDTPPPTVSGHLHLGHVYSYSQTDFIARYRRMRGDNVFYPMGYDDNGLPTDRLVEKKFGLRSREMEREDFIKLCLQVSEKAEAEYQSLWKRIGLSIDWEYGYRTIDECSRHISQISFIDLYQKGLVYRKDAPTIWCPECQSAFAQADLNDIERESELITIEFTLSDGGVLPIATTRPELLPACVAIFVHPSDDRYKDFAGKSAVVPIFGQTVPILNDPKADPETGTGAVMCCTFGDITDVAWWYTHNLGLIELFSRDGSLSGAAGGFAGLSISEAKVEIKKALVDDGKILGIEPTVQSIRVHERCDTPVEYIVTQQWFINVLPKQSEMLQAGEELSWHPPHMKGRYRAWVENLRWDWCISRQRYFGVQFPLWYCEKCGEIILADKSQLPVDPLIDSPLDQCPQCGSKEFLPEEDVFDTWMTSSMTPQIVGGWLKDPELYAMVFPFSLRPQAHEIIRTWAFYTIYKSIYLYNELPWEHLAISGWGIAGEGMGKISKSKGGGPLPPMEMIELYSADGVRYWSASTSLGKDSIISKEKIQTGWKLVTKIWNVARFSERFLESYIPSITPTSLSPADRWILSRLQKNIQRSTVLFDNYDYATAKNEIETFFWTEFADNYLEMCKQRLYEGDSLSVDGAKYTLYHVLLTILKLLAPIMPYITEEIFRSIFAVKENKESIHISSWPDSNLELIDNRSEHIGKILVEIATFVRRFKSENGLPLGTNLSRLIVATEIEPLQLALANASADLKSVTRAERIEILRHAKPEYPSLLEESQVFVYIEK